MRDADALATVREAVERAGAAILPSPTPLFDRRASAVRDPDRQPRSCSALAAAEPASRRAARPVAAPHPGHARSYGAIEDYYVRTLGFLVSDRVLSDEGRVNTLFTRSNHEHHTLACFRQDRVGIDHHSYEAGDWSVIKDWCDRMGDRHIPIMWGPGRHGPGNNLFIFIEDPGQATGSRSRLNSKSCTTAHPRTGATNLARLNSWGPAIMRV